MLWAPTWRACSPCSQVLHGSCRGEAGRPSVLGAPGRTSRCVPLSCRGHVAGGAPVGGLCFVSRCSHVLCPALGVRVGTCQDDCPLRLTCPGPRSAPCFRMSCPRKDASLTACLGGVVVGRPVTGTPGGAAHVVMGGQRWGLCGWRGLRGEGLLEEGLNPLGFPGQEAGPRRTPGMGRLWVSGRAWGQRRPRWRLPHTGVGLCSPKEARTLGPGPGVMPVQPGPQLSILWFSSASSHHTRRSSGSDS